jgi:DNA-binding CsgD family transcriptional regulator
VVGHSEINALIERIHDGVFRLPVATFKDETLVALKTLIHFDSAIWGSGSQEPQLIFGIATHNFPLERLMDYSMRWQPHDALRIAVAARPGLGLRNEDLGPIEDYRASAIYREFCSPAGIEHALGITIVDPITNVGELIFLFRRNRGAYYADLERDAMTQVMPHLVAAWRHRQLLHFRERACKSEEGSAAAPTRQAIIDNLGQVHASDASFGLGMRACFPDWVGPTLPDALMPILANGTTMRAIDGQCFVIERGTDRHILSLIDATTGVPITPAEHRVALLYAEGKTAASVAATLGLSPMTVRNHLTSIYAKIGVHSKVALARWLSAQG